MLGHYPRHWTNITPALGEGLVFSGPLTGWFTPGVWNALICEQLMLGVWLRGALQSQKAISAYFTSKQILPFGFAGHSGGSGGGEQFRYMIIFCKAKNSEEHN